ncbi:MAG: MqnA/MqnD/SBP family protein [Alistipes inops]
MRRIIDRKADIRLRSAEPSQLGDAEIVTNYCIGAEKSVRTVTVMSNVPIGEATVIHLDSHSMTSALLVRILAAELWHIRPEWRELTDYSAAEHPAEGEAFLFIGDKVFGYEGKFRYTYDLADCWRELTGKPFVFAVWVARKGSAPELIDALESSLELGVERIWEAIVESGHSEKDYAYGYLTENIDFLIIRKVALVSSSDKKLHHALIRAKLRPGRQRNRSGRFRHVTHHESQPKRNRAITTYRSNITR